MAAALVVLLLVTIVTQVHSDGNAKMREKLLNDHKDYQKLSHPDDVQLKIGLNYACGQYDKHTHKLTSKVFERYTWTDSRLAWKPADYGGLEKISLPDDKIWTPNLYMLDSIGKQQEREDVNLVVMSSGTVYWDVPATYWTMCKPNHDHDHSAHCTLRLVSLIYDYEAVPLNITSGGFNTQFVLKACPHVPTHQHSRITRAKYDCCPNVVETFQADFDIRERHDEEEEEEHDDPEEKSQRGRRRWEKYLSKARPCAWPQC